MICPQYFSSALSENELLGGQVDISPVPVVHTTLFQSFTLCQVPAGSCI